MSNATEAKILFCDDDSDMLSYYKAIFGKTDHSQYFAQNGTEALKHAESKSIDLAFVDINMPGISGLDVLAQWHEIQPRTQIIIVSSYNDGSMVRVALKNGAFTYLFKPLKKVDIFSVTARALTELGFVIPSL